MIERAQLFGASRHLVGVLTQPLDPAPPGRPGILIFNAGFLHRVGPFRLHVTLARELVRQGFNVLRFDFAGIGDSTVNETAGSRDSSAQDVRDAMDLMQRTTKCEHFIVMGLCSGAKNAHLTSLRETRIKGSVMIDGYAYPTPRYYWRYYRRRLLSRKSWLSFVKRMGPRLRALGTPQAADYWTLVAPPREQAARELADIAGRGIKMLYVFTGESERYNYREQLLDAFRTIDFGDSLTVEFFAEADHTFSETGQRAQLIDCIRSWARKHFISAAGPGSPS